MCAGSFKIPPIFFFFFGSPTCSDDAAAVVGWWIIISGSNLTYFFDFAKEPTPANQCHDYVLLLVVPQTRATLK